MSTKLLDFILIGASKSGTTTLFKYLQYHPQIYIPAEKEVPFFACDEWFEQGWTWFVDEFFTRAPMNVLWGTCTPQYLEDGVRTPKRLFTLMPQVKLIAILRNPIDRAFSAYRMRIVKQREQRSFEQVVSDQLNPEVLARSRELSWHPATTPSCYLATSEYGRMLSQFMTYFPLEQLLILFTDDLEQRPQFVLDSIGAFIGLEPGFSPPNLGKRYYVGGTRKKFPWLIPFTQKISPLRWLWKSLSKDRRRSILWWFNTEVNIVRKTPHQLSPQLRHTLVEFYQPDILELEALIKQKVPWREFHASS